MVSPQVRCPSCRYTLIFSLTLLGWPPLLTSLRNQRWLLSLEPTLTSLWNQRSLLANLAHKRCNCRSSFVIRRFSVLESGWPCGLAADSEFPWPQMTGQSVYWLSLMSCFQFEEQSITETETWCYVACGAGKEEARAYINWLSWIGFSLKAWLEGPIPQLPLITRM